MRQRMQRAIDVVGLTTIMVLVFFSSAAAHTGEGVSLDHVIVEIGTWTLGVVAVIAIVVGIFWVRARVSRG